MKRLPKLSGPFCTILLALGALAFMTATPAAILGQQGTCAGAYSTSFVTSPPYFSGSTVTLTVTMTSQVSGGATTNTEDISEFDFIMDCSNDNGLFSMCDGGTADGNPISYIGPVTTDCEDSSATQVTWSEAAAPPPDGHIRFTPNNPVHFTSDGQSCHITFSLQVNSSADPADNPVVQSGQWVGSCNVDGSTLSGGAQGSDNFNVSSCSVTIDKQISCDGGNTWTNVGPQGSETSGLETCAGFTGDPIQVRYVYQNTGNVDLNSCVIHDVTGQTAQTGTDGTSFTQDTSIATIAHGGSPITSSVITTSDGSTPLTCDAAGPNYDTANIDCVCGTTSIHTDAHDTADFSCESCSVQIDKQVACAGASPVDVFGTDDSVNSDTPPSADTTVDTCTGYEAYTGHSADNVAVQYVITNTGTDSVHGCTYSESNSAVITGSPTSPCTPAAISDGTNTPATLTSSQSTTTQAFTHACSPDLTQCEVSGQNTATIGCTCDPLTNNSITDRQVGFHDTAGFNCLAPGLNVTKTCDQQSGGLNHVTVTATNTSTDTPLYNCMASDTYDTSGACTTSTTSTPYANPLSLTGPASTDLGVSGSSTASQTWTADLSGLSSTACNNGAVTCHLESSTGPTISANYNATCPVSQGCETRTPGFWKTHPDTSYAVMTAAGGAIQSCGLNLDNVMAGNDCSAIEDMCSLGQDAAKLGINPVQANLIFQCAAAELNLAVTQQDGGDCGATIPNSTLTFAGCCGLAGSCATADQATLDACQQAVSAFNAQYDTVTLTSGSVLNNPGADPTACQSANGNGFVNDQSAIGSSVADCGGARMYLQKSTGGGNPHNASSTNNGQHKGQNK